MAQEWPQFQCRILTYAGWTVGSWRGRVQPIKKTDGLFELLDDLHHDRDVYTRADEVLHLASCESHHCHHDWMDRIGDVSLPFDLEIWYEGNDALPKCWVLFPVILKPRHMWLDGSICAFLDSDEVWLPERDTVADFIPHALLWIVKWKIYNATNFWIGAEHRGTPDYHLETINPDARCWCQSGSPYNRCHQDEDRRISRMMARGQPAARNDTTNLLRRRITNEEFTDNQS